MFLTTPSITWPSASLATISERCSARVASRISRRETTMLPRRRSIFRILKGCGEFMSGPMSRTGRHVHLAARQERHGAVEIDREAALDLVEDDAFDLLLVVEFLLQAGPALLAPRLFARQHGLAQRVLDALEIDLDGVADLESVAWPGMANSRSCTRPSIFRPTSITARSFSMRGDLALDDAALEDIVLPTGFRPAARRIRRAWD